MKLFLKNVGEFLKDYPQVRLTRSDEILIRNSSMQCLGLDNVNHLRDRFEGQAFLDKTLKNIGALFACQKHLNIGISDLSELNLRDFSPRIKINDKTLLINVFNFGELPFIDLNDNNNNPTIFVIQKDKLTFMICGFAESEFIRDNLIESTEATSSSKNFKSFVGFKELQSINFLK